MAKQVYKDPGISLFQPVVTYLYCKEINYNVEQAWKVNPISNVGIGVVSNV